MDIMVVPLSLLVGLVAVFLILLHLYGRIGDKKLDEIRKRLEELEKSVANLDIKNRETDAEIEGIKRKNEDYVKLFKTVLHGFDYIVQGCKSALGIEGGVERDERVVSSGEQRRIPEPGSEE